MSVVHTEIATAAQLRERASRQVGGLLARDVRPGDWVAFAAPGSLDLLAAVHGCLLSGIAPVVLSSTLTAHERAELVGELPIAAVVDAADLATAAAAERPAGRSAALGDFHRCRPIHVTSGTTGRPKAVWSGWLDAAAATALYEDERGVWDFGPDDVHLVVAPMSHSAPLRFALNTLLAGGAVAVVPKFDRVVAWDAIATHRPTTSFMAPAHLLRLLEPDVPTPGPDVPTPGPDVPTPGPNVPTPEADISPRDLSSFRLVAHAGSPCPERVKRAALAAFGVDVVTEFYGSTEAQFTVCPGSEWLAHPGTVGRSRPGRALRVVDGTVWVRLPEYARFEYWDAPDKTAAAWDGDWFTAGDLGELDPGGYLTLRGRDGDLVISGGVNVYPAEVERALRELPGVDDAVVFGRPDDRWGEQVCAVVAASSPDVDVAALEAFVSQRLAPAKRPRRWTVLADLPRTHSGKPDRHAARDLASSGAPSKSPDGHQVSPSA